MKVSVGMFSPHHDAARGTVRGALYFKLQGTVTSVSGAPGVQTGDTVSISAEFDDFVFEPYSIDANGIESGCLNTCIVRYFPNSNNFFVMIAGPYAVSTHNASQTLELYFSKNRQLINLDLYFEKGTNRSPITVETLPIMNGTVTEMHVTVNAQASFTAQFRYQDYREQRILEAQNNGSPLAPTIRN
ncbi:MAG: hypothetical protein R3E84_00180 [Pseudomonadales bacterium]